MTEKLLVQKASQQMSPAVLPLDEDFLPALTSGEGLVSPAGAWLLSLHSVNRGQKMNYFSHLPGAMLVFCQCNDTCTMRQR
ncbi:hypothetical protein ACXGPA_21920 (plasmid) [Enterobacter asburiae]